MENAFGAMNRLKSCFPQLSGGGYTTVLLTGSALPLSCPSPGCGSKKDVLPPAGLPAEHNPRQARG